MPGRRRKPRRRQAKQERSRATVETILEGAARVLARVGLERATTDRIARAAGISVGSLYQYYANKEAIVAALIERHFDRVMRVFRDHVAESTSRSLPDAVAHVVRSMIAAQCVDADLHRVLDEQVPKVGQLPKLRTLRAEAATLIRAFLESRKRELAVRDLDLAAFLIVHSVDSLVSIGVNEAPEYLAGERLQHEITALVTRYLGVER
jgi:AcrR family transcriptional regulator